MAQNITLLGASYSAVPAVMLPKTGGGTASFTDVTDTTAAAADVASGKYFYTAAGVRTAGTASGGGGTPLVTLVASAEYTVSTTDTSASAVGTIQCDTSIYTKNSIIWVHVRDTAGARNGYFYGSDVFFVNTNAASGGTNAFAIPARVTIRSGIGQQKSIYSGTGYGVYGYSITKTGGVNIQRRYNSSNSKTINGTYLVQVLKIDMPEGVEMFP